MPPEVIHAATLQVPKVARSVLKKAILPRFSLEKIFFIKAFTFLRFHIWNTSYACSA